jgi:hypothetical protein
MKLTPLDLGIGRFLEFSFTLVYPEVYAEEDLQAAARLCSRDIPCLDRVSTFLYTTPCPTYTLALVLADELTPSSQRNELRPREGVNIFQSRHVDGSL